MAKDLPYFKFFCSEWADGDITLETYKTQGLFINICAYYWSNECLVSEDKLLKKFRHDIKEIEKLCSLGIIKVVSEQIIISFLDEQIKERGKLSSQNSINAKKRWEKDATAQNSHSEKDAIKRREEKKREEKNKGVVVVGFEWLDVEGYFYKQAVEYKLDSAKLLKKVLWAYEYYKELGFKNSKGKEIKNLNSTIKNNWIKDYDEYLVVKKFIKPTIAL